MTPRRRATLRDIAAALDLSVNTVSRALAGKDAVSPETRERVRAEAERLGYVPNTMARSLVQGNAMTIGLVITNPSNPFYARLISAIEERGRVHGYALMLMVTEDSVENERRVVDELMRWGVDGVLAVPVQHGSDHWERLRKSGTPVVLLNRDLPELDTDLVGVDYYDSARRATEHLVAGGARDLYLVEEDLDISPVAERVRGFRTVLDEHGVTVRDDHMVKVPTRRREASSQPWDPVDSYEIGRELAARIEPGAAVLARQRLLRARRVPGVHRARAAHPGGRADRRARRPRVRRLPRAAAQHRPAAGRRRRRHGRGPPPRTDVGRGRGGLPAADAAARRARRPRVVPCGRRLMGRFLLRRAGQALIVAWGAITLVFVVVRVVPGDPATLILGPDASPAQLASVRADFGLDDPLWRQYLAHMGEVLRGDFGDSWRLGGGAMGAVLDRFPATLTLAALALAITLAAGYPLGMLCARRPGGVLDWTVSTGSLIGQAVPSFWLGIVLILLFARQLNWLPSTAGGGPEAVILPSVTLALPFVGWLARLVRNGALEESGKDYVRTARAKGTGEGAVMYVHVARNIALPVVTVLGLLMGNFIANAVIVEVVFSWPGIGSLMVDAITNRDYAVVEAAIVTITVSYIALNLLVDVLCVALDPRLTPENA
ncbi:ABC transporter permease subunit [Actinomadura madurae]|uniref:ABC transporter permease subunit n=1 Tax=Actinomadura madurae TaxID=1993 RepID=UPI0020D1F9ED|nr:ABC transporter permease subunit [Actinomadura madurae]MCP9947397.1 ABC transporter permease subunit [Actinomadura madurae]